jgi:hypothetical protein
LAVPPRGAASAARTPTVTRPPTAEPEVLRGGPLILGADVPDRRFGRR